MRKATETFVSVALPLLVAVMLWVWARAEDGRIGGEPELQVRVAPMCDGRGAG